MWHGVQKFGKTIVKKPLNAIGLDLVRLAPAEATRQVFKPTEARKFIWMSSLDINTVVDVGAHVGEFAMKIHAILPSASIFSFEPLSDCFKQLQTNLGSVPKFHAFHYALGDSNTTMVMHRNEFEPSSSLRRMTDVHKKAFPFTARESCETVEVRRLDDVMGGISLEENVLIKLDVQGYEDKVISGGENVISRARLLVIEVSFQVLYEGQPLFDDIYRSVKARGFNYIGNLDQLRNPIDGSVLQADAVFIKA